MEYKIYLQIQIFQSALVLSSELKKLSTSFEEESLFSETNTWKRKTMYKVVVRQTGSDKTCQQHWCPLTQPMISFYPCLTEHVLSNAATGFNHTISIQFQGHNWAYKEEAALINH